MSNNKYKLLIVDGDRTGAEALRGLLEECGYQVLTAQDGRQGLLMYTSHMPDLVIQELTLPDQSGLDLLRSLRNQSAVPVLVLSERTAEADKVAALDTGANDYVTKPYGTEELPARIRAALRNCRQHLSSGTASMANYGALRIDYDRRRVTVAEVPVRLTRTEYNILALLSQNPGKVMTYAALIRGVWGTVDEGSIKKLQVNVTNIRKKLGSSADDRCYILNEPGAGYRMAEKESEILAKS